MDLQIPSLVSDFKKTNAFLVYAMCYHETVHDKLVYVKAFGKLKMAQNAVIMKTGKTLWKSGNWPKKIY